MNTLARLDLLPAPRKSLISAARDLLRRSLHGLSAQAQRLNSRAVTTLYGEPLTLRPVGTIMPRASNPERYQVSPETINDDVFTSIRCAWAIHTGQWEYEGNSAVVRVAHEGPSVKLSACLLCDWTGHVS